MKYNIWYVIRLLYYFMERMEKLIELLNEYELGKDNYSGVISEGDIYYYSVLYISKEYWFIKWLVENDKIDKNKIDTRLVKSVESHYDVDWWWVENSYEDYSDTDTLLMLLSISNSPIDDLISYLK